MGDADTIYHIRTSIFILFKRTFANSYSCQKCRWRSKFEVEEVKLVSNKGLKAKDVSLALSLIEENREIIIAKWIEYHGKQG